MPSSPEPTGGSAADRRPDRGRVAAAWAVLRATCSKECGLWSASGTPHPMDCRYVHLSAPDGGAPTEASRGSQRRIAGCTLRVTVRRPARSVRRIGGGWGPIVGPVTPLVSRSLAACGGPRSRRAIAPLLPIPLGWPSRPVPGSPRDSASDPRSGGVPSYPTAPWLPPGVSVPLLCLNYDPTQAPAYPDTAPGDDTNTCQSGMVSAIVVDLAKQDGRQGRRNDGTRDARSGRRSGRRRRVNEEVF